MNTDIKNNKKILFILFEGLPTNVIDSQVLERINILQKNTNLSFEILSFACSANLYHSSKKRYRTLEVFKDIKTTLWRGARPAIPFSRIFNGILIMFYLIMNRNKYFVIHARTEYSVACSIWAKKIFSLPVIWDSRGDGLAEFHEKTKHKKKWIKILIDERKKSIIKERMLACSESDYALFVSKKLKERLYNHQQPCMVIPCTASSQVFFYKESLRQYKRESLNYKDNELIFLYAGSINFFQCFNAVMTSFQKISSYHDNARLLVLTPHIEDAKKYMDENYNQKITLKKANFKEMNAYLNVADIAFVLREDNKLNNVAFPTKISEFLMTGLPIIMNEHKTDFNEVVQNLNAFISIDDCNNGYYPYDQLSSYRENISGEAKKVLSTESYIAKILDMYEGFID